jgi:hypothetical protein
MMIVAMLRRGTVRRSLTVSRRLAIRSRTVGIMMIRMLHHHSRRRRRGLLATSNRNHG